MGQLRDKMMNDLERAGYVPKTRAIYLNAIRDFAAHYRRQMLPSARSGSASTSRR